MIALNLPQCIFRLSILFSIFPSATLFCSEIALPLPEEDHKDKTPYTYILAVGISQYQDNFWPTLKFAHNDADKFSKELKENHPNPVKVKLLLNDQATLANVLDSLAETKKNIRPQDQFIFYFSGHGTLGLASDGDIGQFSILHDTQSSQLNTTALSRKKFMNMLNALNAKRKLAILASCHSGIGKSKLHEDVQKILSGGKGKALDFENASEGVLVFSAAAKGETAREDEKLEGDIYTHFFLKALTTFDRNQDGGFSALEAHDFAKKKTFDYTHGKQRPTLESQAIGEADFILTGKLARNANPVIFAYDESLNGIIIETQSQNEKGAQKFTNLKEGHKAAEDTSNSGDSAPTAIALKPGKNIVEVYLPESFEKLATFEIDAEEGEQINLKDLFRPPLFFAGVGLMNASAGNVETKNIARNGRFLGAKWEIGHFISDFVFIKICYSGFNSKENQFNSYLSNDFNYSSFTGHVGIAKNWLPFSPYNFDTRLALGLGLASSDLEVYENETDFSLKKSSQAPLKDVQINLLKSLTRGFTLQMGTFYEVAEFDYETLGKFNYTTFGFSIGIEYRFGNKGQRL